VALTVAERLSVAPYVAIILSRESGSRFSLQEAKRLMFLRWLVIQGRVQR
jgi:hypothetical protein